MGWSMSLSDGAAEVLTADALSTEIGALARELAALTQADGQASLPDDTLDSLLTAAVKLYVARQQASDTPLTWPAALADASLDPGETVLVINRLLRVADVDHFELALWHSWGKA